jgi:hypothetical protein
MENSSPNDFSFHRKCLNERLFTETPFNRTPFDPKVILPKKSFKRQKFLPKGLFTEKIGKGSFDRNSKLKKK